MLNLQDRNKNADYSDPEGSPLNLTTTLLRGNTEKWLFFNVDVAISD